MLDALLVYPPFANPFYPYLSTPTLSAYLKENNRSVEQRDLNLELFDDIFTTDYLNNLEESLTRKINYLDDQSSLTWDKQEELTQLICLKIALDDLNNSFDIKPEEVKKQFRDINSYRYEDNEPFLLESWSYYQKLTTIISYNINKLNLSVCDTKSVQRSIEGSEYYLYYDLMSEKYVKDLLKNNPKFVGISITYQTQVVPSLYLAYLLKKENPDIHLCIGGQHFSTISQDIPKLYENLPFVDSFVVDEGELAILKILDYIDDKCDLNDVPNIIYKDKNKQIIVNNKDFVKDINTLPLPDFEGLPLKSYFTGKVVLPYSASKGCYYNKCTFCSFPFISPRYRILEPERVAQDLKELSEKYDTNLFYLTNEADPPKRIKQTSEAIIAANLNIYYHSFCRFDRKVDWEMGSKLAQSGCKVLFFGLESAVDRINEMMMNKGIRLDNAEEILKMCDELKISTIVSSIVGFPTETIEESMQTKEFLRDHSYYKNHVPQSHTFRMPRGTDTEISHKKYGVDNLYRNEGNLATILSNYETNYERVYDNDLKEARLDHETVGVWPHHDCLELLYADYYNGDIPVIFGYNKELPKNEKGISKISNFKKTDSGTKYVFDELIQRKNYRQNLSQLLYRKGYQYEEIAEIISNSVLGKETLPYQTAIFADFQKIKSLFKQFEDQFKEVV